MTPQERDNEQLGIILRYCERMGEALALLGNDFETFEGSSVLQDSCSLCLIQIGEAVNRLSGDFREHHPQIEWAQIHGLRCHLVHGYEMFDAEIVWDAIENEIPSLRAFCEERFVEAVRPRSLPSSSRMCTARTPRDSAQPLARRAFA